jgi:uncharacterized protein (DUF849 family)
MTDVLLQGCLNGAREPGAHPALPLSPEELARDAAAAVAAGARSLHLHPRDGSGRESLEPAVTTAALAAVRAAVPGVEISLSTGLWIAGDDPERRHALVETWDVLPDLVSLNVGETGWERLGALLSQRGVGIEIGLGGPADVEGLASAGLASACVRALGEPEEEEAGLATATSVAIDDALDAAGIELPRLHHGIEAATWAVMDAAVQRGHDVRVGLEDTFELPDGGRAAGNAELLAVAAERYGVTAR